MINLKNVNLQIAGFAMQKVSDTDENKHIDSKKYKTLVKKMSAMIQKNGLIGTLVFNLSKSSRDEHAEVLNQIIDWNKENYKISDLISDYNKDEQQTKYTTYIEDLVKLSSQDYRLITKEMMALFGWMKRFADGMIKGEE